MAVRALLAYVLVSCMSLFVEWRLLHVLFDFILLGFILKNRLKFSSSIYIVLILTIYKIITVDAKMMNMLLIIHFAVIAILASISGVDESKSTLEWLVLLVFISVIAEIVSRSFGSPNFNFLYSKEHLVHSHGREEINLFSGVFKTSKQLARFSALAYVISSPRLLSRISIMLLFILVVSGVRESLILIFFYMAFKNLRWRNLGLLLFFLIVMYCSIPNISYYVPSFEEVYSRMENLLWFIGENKVRIWTYFGEGFGHYGNELTREESLAAFYKFLQNLDVEKVADSGFVRLYINYGVIGILSFIVFTFVCVLRYLTIRAWKNIGLILLTVTAFIKGHPALLDALNVFMFFYAIREIFKGQPKRVAHNFQ